MKAICRQVRILSTTVNDAVQDDYQEEMDESTLSFLTKILARSLRS